MATDTELWTIGELRSRARRALSSGYIASDNGQISAIPDARTIRYYCTLGLVDRPAEMRGRTALYSRHHLMQVVAIKRLQAEGLRLAQIQEQLAGLQGDALDLLAQVPAVSGPPSRDAAPLGPSARRESFWSAPVEPSGEPVPVGAPAASRKPASASPRPAAPLRARTQLNLELAAGVHILVDTDQIPSQADREVLGQAAQKLLDALRACGLHEPQTRRPR